MSDADPMPEAWTLVVKKESEEVFADLQQPQRQPYEEWLRFRVSRDFSYDRWNKYANSGYWDSI